MYEFNMSLSEPCTNSDLCIMRTQSHPNLSQIQAVVVFPVAATVAFTKLLLMCIISLNIIVLKENKADRILLHSRTKPTV